MKVHNTVSAKKMIKYTIPNDPLGLLLQIKFGTKEDNAYLLNTLRAAE